MEGELKDGIVWKREGRAGGLGGIHGGQAQRIDLDAEGVSDLVRGGVARSGDDADEGVS